ncbi:MAG TPA: T9SS type A sorting domain-containing protein, partial [Chitinophagaceae bacterium]|nr:T9SS type A sorting domain-containing protein [Chitinophagaceae bacterium]
MKKHFFLLIASAICLFSSVDKAVAQCPGGYTQAQLNWDNLDYYFNNGLNVRPYGYGSPNGTFISDAMEQTQKFAIGTNWLSIVTSSNALINPGNFNGVTGENAIHTGNIAGYAGDDVQYNPSANGQTITITFNTQVANASFTLYDVDGASRIDFAAQNSIAIPQVINMAFQGGSTLTPFLNNTITPYVVGAAANDANNINNSTVTVTVAGPVKQITISCTTMGTDPVFWLSDINACVTGSFPPNYQQSFNTRPFYGPVISQPDYFLVTPDNNSCYMQDPATGTTRWLFTDASNTYMNSFAYDPGNRILYYISEGLSLNRNNKTLKKYDFNTETISTVVADIVTTLGIPTFNGGVESGGAAYYDDKLYIGIEGGQYNSTNTRESMIWCIEFDASLNPNNAYQVYSTNTYSGSNIIHDWADFLIKNGVLYNYNSAKTSTPTYPNSSYTHIDLMTGVATKYINPTPANPYAGQAGMSWNGNQYSIRNVIQQYNEDGTLGVSVPITVVGGGPAWVANAGDASENFRPKCDFGDAPATYDPYADPATQSPAVHERSELIRLGATWDNEFWKRGTAGTDDTDDGLAYTPIMAPGGGGYVVQVAAFNNSGADATMIAWLDYNGNGVFDAAEAITPITVPTSASSQNFWLYWPVTTNTFSNGDFTYLRIRITAASAGMTTSHPTGYFTNGEVEDYRILVDNFPLANHLLNFEASLQDKKVKLNWEVSEDAGLYAYEIERSRDNINWTKITTVNANGTAGTYNYESIDANPLKGISYYRLRLIESTGMNRFSLVKRITIKDLESGLIVAPNPAKDNITIRFDAAGGGDIEISILNMQGSMQLTRKQRITAGLNNIMISLPETMSAGTYVARIVVGGEVVYKKLIVNK